MSSTRSEKVGSSSLLWVTYEEITTTKAWFLSSLPGICSLQSAPPEIFLHICTEPLVLWPIGCKQQQQKHNGGARNKKKIIFICKQKSYSSFRAGAVGVELRVSALRPMSLAQAVLTSAILLPQPSRSTEIQAWTIMLGTSHPYVLHLNTLSLDSEVGCWGLKLVHLSDTIPMNQDEYDSLKRLLSTVDPPSLKKLQMINSPSQGESLITVTTSEQFGTI